VLDMQTSDTQRAQEQGKRLRKLRENRGISKGRLMDTLGLESTNGYDLYERGKSVIRLDRVSEWAAAFEMSERAFLDAVLMSDDDPEWDFLAELRQLWPDDPGAVERTYRGLAQASQDIQRIVISEIRKAFEEEQPRAVPEERADYRCGVAG
jgi:transcriptional regulator with XRE-family HTH domain